MPVLNEEAYLADAVHSVLSQQYDGPQELILALAPSTDHTDDIASRLAAADPRITLVQNPAAHIPDGLNAAIRAAKYDVIIRVDAHSELSPNYTALGIQTLRETGAGKTFRVSRGERSRRISEVLTLPRNRELHNRRNERGHNH